MAMMAMTKKTRPTGSPTFSPSFLLAEGADEEAEWEESAELEVDKRVKVGPSKGLGFSSSWLTMRERVRLAVDWPLSQAEGKLRKTEPW